METLVSWFTEQVNIVSYLQIGLDLALIAFVAILIKGRQKAGRDSEDAGGEASQALDKVIADTKAIAQELDANMQERQRLIQQVVAGLDQRLATAVEICQRLEALSKEAHSASVTTPSIAPKDSGQREILRLSRLGLDAGAISERLQKPLGEVELVLSLKRLAPER